MGRRNVYRYLLVICMFVASTLVISPSDTQASTLEKWLIMPGPVVASHEATESECSNCHDPLSDQPQHELCVACHTEVGLDVDEKTGFHGRLQASERLLCSSCHTDHEGREMSIVDLNENTFNHELTDFSLRGAHTEVGCSDCHASGEAHREAATSCIGCHRNDDPHDGQLGEACDSCHNEVGWNDAVFDHSTTAFPLTGGHSALDCAGCHLSEDFAEVGKTCVACHGDNDPHRGRNGDQCADCHNSTDWDSVSFDHLRVSGFALNGGHNNLSCTDCHQAADYLDLAGSDCNSCHQKDDIHEGRNGPDCAACHSVSNWRAVNFNHATQTSFALPAGHEDITCEGCHIDNVHDALPTDCNGCHSNDDPHEGQLGNECDSCHVASDWTAQLWFDHDILSFPLIGAHADVACDQCHTTPAFRDTEDYCVACHGDDDPHRGGLGNQCDTCHTPVDWQAWQFDHDVQTDFPLMGGHLGLECKDCHAPSSNHEAAVPDDCNSCHRRDDPHRGRFGNNCDSCHNSTSFSQIEGM